jgi:hypothetical protein
MSTPKYDDAKNHAQVVFCPNLTGLSVPGTAASATDLLRIPAAAQLHVNKARLRLLTGGTAAGPVITFNTSLAGTGAVAPIGTHTFGTSADGSVASVTLADTVLAANDELVIQNVAGTVAATPKIVFSIGYAD